MCVCLQGLLAGSSQLRSLGLRSVYLFIYFFNFPCFTKFLSFVVILKIRMPGFDRHSSLPPLGTVARQGGRVLSLPRNCRRASSVPQTNRDRGALIPDACLLLPWGSPRAAILTTQGPHLPCAGALGRGPLIALGISRDDAVLAYLTPWESEGASPGPSAPASARPARGPSIP